MTTGMSLHSTNHRSAFEQCRDSVQQLLNKEIVLILLAVFGFTFFPEIYKQFARYPSHQYKAFSPVVKALIVICGSAGMYFLTAHFRAAIKEYEHLIKLSSKEYLIVDTEKISGETQEGDLKLYYNQIQQVQLRSESIPKDKRLKQTEITVLSITDIVGNEFIFQTFSNCRELKHYIDEGIANV